MSPSEYRSSMKEMIRWAEGVMRLKAVVDQADAMETKTAALEHQYAAAVAGYDKEIDQCVERVKEAQALMAKATGELTKHQADCAQAHADLDAALADAKDKHTKTVASMKDQAQATYASINSEKAAAMKAMQDAIVLHSAEMQAMQAEKVKMEYDLRKLREVRQQLLAQLQTGV